MDHKDVWCEDIDWIHLAQIGPSLGTCECSSDLWVL
jgi:hypothetical protein